MKEIREKIEFIHSNLIERLTDINNLLYKNTPEDEKLDKYTKITSFYFLSCAIEAIIGVIIENKYETDKFAYNFINKKNKYSGMFLEYELIESLIDEVEYSNIKTQELTREFYSVCKEQIYHYITQTKETCIFDNESFKDIYTAVKKERNKIVHEFTWNNNNFTAGMLVKFIKVYFTLYTCAINIIEI